MLAIIIIIAIAIIAAGTCIMPRNDGSNSIDGNGLTAGQKSDAIGIALGDPSIKSKLWSYAGKSQVNGVSLLGSDGEAGYVNFNDTIAQVPFHFGTGGIESERMISYVDLNTSKVIGSAWYSYRSYPMSVEVTIPPGAYWYYHLQPGIMSGSSPWDQGTAEMTPSVNEIVPENASIYPIILDQYNMDLFLNASPYQALVYSNDRLNRTMSTNGTIPYSHNWSTHVSIPVSMAPDGQSIPNYKIPSTYYAMFKNGDVNRSVTINFVSAPM